MAGERAGGRSGGGRLAEGWRTVLCPKCHDVYQWNDLTCIVTPTCDDCGVNLTNEPDLAEADRGS